MKLRVTTYILYTIFVSNIALCQTWSQIANFPDTERDDATSFVIGDKAYCGTGLKTGWTPCRDMHSFHMLTEVWETISSLPIGMERQYATGFSDGSRGFIFGGIEGSNHLNDLWMYDPSTGNWQSKAPLPSFGRKGMSNFVINDTAYIIGGSSTSATALSEVWAYNMTSDSWTLKDNLPFGGRWRAAATSIANKGYLIFGLDSANNYRKELFQFDPLLNQWNLISNFPEAGRVYSSLQNYQNQLILLMGLDSLQTNYKDMWHFDLLTSTWNQLTPLPSDERRGGLCFVNSNTLFYTTGINQANERLKETWKIVHPLLKNDNLKITDFTIYPNPVTDVLHLTFESSHLNLKELVLTNLAGQVVRRYAYESSPNGGTEIPVSGLQGGMYFLDIIFKEGKNTLKILIE